MLGHSWMGRTHTQAFKTHALHFPSDAKPRFVGIYGRNQETLKADAERWGYEYATSDWEKVVRDDSVDVVVNALPNNLHRDPCIAAAEAGKDVICEKPLALNTTQSAEMLAAAENAGIKDMMVFNYRWLPAVQMAKRMIEEGRLGKILQYRGLYAQSWLVSPNAVASWKVLKETSGAGVLFDLGPHSLDLAMHLVSPISELVATTHTVAESRVKADGSLATKDELGEEFGACLLKFENGTRGTIEVSRVASGFMNKNRIEVHGTEGALAFDLENLNTLKVFDFDDEAPGFRDHVVDSHNVGWSRAFLLQTHNFLDCIEGDSRPEPNWKDGHAVMVLMENFLKSAEEGGWVRAL
jgi:predicted dehydrogenase